MPLGQGGLQLSILIVTYLSELFPKSFRNHSENAIIFNMETPIYISGLDSTELSNLLKRWFKWDGLFNIAKNSESVKEHKLSDEAISAVIYSIEDELVESLVEYANQLEESRKEVDSFMRGASWALDHKKDEEF